MDEKKFSQIERYSGEIKKLSMALGVESIRREIFKLQLAARREDLIAAAENLGNIIEELNILVFKSKGGVE